MCEMRRHLEKTFKTLDLKEYECQSCGRLFTLYHVIKEWPEGTKKAEVRSDLLDG